MSRDRHHIAKLAVTGVALVLLLFGAFTLATYITEHPTWQATIASWGYLGVLITAIIAGLNVIVPFPAASFTPVFMAAELNFWLIILWLTVGTVIADCIGYVFGHYSRSSLAAKYPKAFKRFTRLYTERRHWLIPAVFFYAAFVPIPNEAMVIPLALLGVPVRVLIIPLFVGNFINQAIYAYGIYNAFLWLS